MKESPLKLLVWVRFSSLTPIISMFLARLRLFWLSRSFEWLPSGCSFRAAAASTLFSNWTLVFDIWPLWCLVYQEIPSLFLREMMSCVCVMWLTHCYCSFFQYLDPYYLSHGGHYILGFTKIAAPNSYCVGVFQWRPHCRNATCKGCANACFDCDCGLHQYSWCFRGGSLDVNWKVKAYYSMSKWGWLITRCSSISQW